MDDTKTKYCGHCHTEKPISEFYTNKSKPGGLATYCKECTKELQRGYSKKAYDKKHGKTVEAKLAPIQVAPVVSPVQKPTSLSDFTPREIIKYMHGLGYRIENNQLVYYSKQVVNLKDVING
jgi:hypothetical protein